MAVGCETPGHAVIGNFESLKSTEWLFNYSRRWDMVSKACHGRVHALRGLNLWVFPQPRVKFHGSRVMYHEHGFGRGSTRVTCTKTVLVYPNYLWL